MQSFSCIRIMATLWLLALLFAASEQAEGATSDAKTDAKTDAAPKAEIATENLTDELVASEEYESAAVATDSEICSNVGKDILQEGGSAVDSAIASLICLGTVQFQSSGLGGGGFLLNYDKATRKMHAFDFRETVPKEAKAEVFNKDPEKAANGPLSVGVPGELKGLKAAHDKFGKLEWAKLIEPSIKLAKEGFKASKYLAIHAKKRLTKIKDVFLKRLITGENGTAVKEDALIRREKYAKTLEIIKEDPSSLWQGTLADQLIADITEQGGILTKDDLKNYEVKQPAPIEMELGDNKLATLPLPSGGPVLFHILSMCKEFNFNKDDLAEENLIKTYHRAVECFKFSQAYKPYLCDPDFVKDATKFGQMYKDILNPEKAKEHKERIDEAETKKIKFYGDAIDKTEEQGTTHVSVLAKNGDAVSVTSSLNFKFGALIASKQTGIIFNNQIEDLFIEDSPEKKYTRGKENGIQPGARPLSSMVPNIIVDSDGKVIMISGASGGNRITLSVSWVIMMKMVFGMDLGNAVMMSRPYHSFFPTYIRNEKQFPMKAKIVDGLKQKKHDVKNSSLDAAVQAIFVKDGKIFAKSDPRKYGKTAGY